MPVSMELLSMVSRAAQDHIPDNSDGIAIATLYLVVMMVLAVFIRLAFRYTMLRSLQWDDGMVSLALVLGIAQSSCILAGTNHGLGKPQSDLQGSQIDSIQRDVYASDLLYVISLSLAKISVLEFLKKLCVNKTHKKICFWSSIVIAIWTVPVFFVLAFQCGMPSPWNQETGHCINNFDFWVAISPVDIITELIICLLPVFVIYPVQVAFSKKVTVVLAFVSRFFVIIATIARLAFLQKPTIPTHMAIVRFDATITTQTVLCISLMTACIPCLKPFLDAFDSGMLSVSMKRRAGGGSNSYGNSYAMGSMNRATKQSARQSRYVEDEVENLGTSAAAFAVSRPGKPTDEITSTTMAIQRTDQWVVSTEYVHDKAHSVTDETDVSDTRGSRDGRSM